MKRKRHTPESIMRKLREADALLVESKTIVEINPPLESREPAFHRWRNQYGGREHDQDGSPNGDDMKPSRRFRPRTVAPRNSRVCRGHTAMCCLPRRWLKARYANWKQEMANAEPRRPFRDF